MHGIVGVITRAISVSADATILGLTLWKTVYIFKVDPEVRENSRLTTTLARTGSFFWYYVTAHSRY